MLFKKPYHKNNNPTTNSTTLNPNPPTYHKNNTHTTYSTQTLSCGGLKKIQPKNPLLRRVKKIQPKNPLLRRVKKFPANPLKLC